MKKNGVCLGLLICGENVIDDGKGGCSCMVFGVFFYEND